MTAATTIVIATRDRRDPLLRTLGELTALPDRPPVIVVDNGSRDGSPDAVRDAFPGVRVVGLPRNHGACARNVGVRLATTPYVAFSDDDSWWEPDALGAAARLMDAHPRLAVLIGRIHLGSGDVDVVSRKMRTAPIGRAPDLPGPSVLGFPACAAVVRRTAFLAAGGFDDLLFFGGEESLLALDLAAGGWGLAYADEVVARHSPASGRDETPPERWALHRRNDLLVTWMRLSGRRALARTLGLAAQAVRDPAARSAFGGLLRRLPAALARRRPVPPAVAGGVRALRELE
ncbi:glycosyltransferase family 2 protein [Actinomadura rayongensis]|uniref:Glycosyltransferase n=1 Tax=Actinomadura rayongensis TaxID=1429076 RepID=A0A6I4WD66_9ACTN|nr:glycosyltransferase [Actinomadura rayongensis]MXQ66185.1 glycosyltransferase [Actinomadura rayongensis]